MNPRRLADFFRSKFGLFLIFVIVLFTGLWIYGRNRSEAEVAAKHAPAQAKKVELGQVKIPLDQGLEDGLPQQVRPSARGSMDVPADGIVPFRPPSAIAAPGGKATVVKRESASPQVAAPKPKKVRYPSLLVAHDLPPAPKPMVTTKRSIPFGTLLKCKLVNTVDSMNAETPVIALLLEDVCQNGERVIPANTLVHGTARAGRMRDRLTASGGWRFVWQDGRELSFTGIALDREYAHAIDGYGITDGSAGIRGRVIASDDLQELKLLAASALSGFARGTQDRSQTALGTTITGSVANRPLKNALF